jgi:hypothetical protein
VPATTGPRLRRRQLGAVATAAIVGSSVYANA